MSYLIKTLEWDSAFFNKRIGEVFKVENTTSTNNSSYDFDLLIYKDSKNIPIEIKGFENRFQETKYVFSKDITVIKKNTLHKIHDYDDDDKEAKAFYDLAYESGKFSRFKLDSYFKHEDFYNLYNKWIENTLNKSYADKLFYILDQEEVIGFITIKNNTSFASVGLIAVSEAYQGKGLGRQLINKAENYCVSQNIKTLKIPTQKKNKNACHFYLKLGYEIVEQTYINHFWNLKNDPI